MKNIFLTLIICLSSSYIEVVQAQPNIPAGNSIAMVIEAPTQSDAVMRARGLSHCYPGMFSNPVLNCSPL